jgi:hypothetical protein
MEVRLLPSQGDRELGEPSSLVIPFQKDGSRSYERLSCVVKLAEGAELGHGSSSRVLA